MATPIPEHMKGLKLSKSERRVRKKQYRSQATMLRHLENVSCSEEPTANVLVANGGLGNGVEREQLWAVFESCGDVCNVIMLPGKPFSFVCFTDPHTASRAVTELHGKSLQECLQEDTVESGANVILYLSYVNQVPEVSERNEIRFDAPPGLTIHPDLISVEEENRLLQTIDWNNPHGSGNVLKHRRVRHCGYAFDYSINNVDKTKPLEEGFPEEFRTLIQRLIDLNVIQGIPGQLTVNQYQPGQGIPPHVDTHSAFEEEIVIINLQSQTVMEFHCMDAEDERSVVLPGRSVVVMKGEARYRWSHAITPRKSDIVPVSDVRTQEQDEREKGLTLLKRGVRTSLTFRKVLHQPCQCDKGKSAIVCSCPYMLYMIDMLYTQLTLDSVIVSSTVHNSLYRNHNKSLISGDMTEQAAVELERKHVLQVYSEIADHFSDTRHTPWPRVAHFLLSLPDASIVADVGCGNGKYLNVNPKLFMVGGDTSARFCEIVRGRGYGCHVSDVMSIPVRAGSCDAVICIAVIHHLATRARRLRALCNLARLLRTGGKALVYVWALEQKRNNVKSKYLKPSKPSSSSSSIVPTQPSHDNDKKLHDDNKLSHDNKTSHDNKLPQNSDEKLHDNHMISSSPTSYHHLTAESVNKTRTDVNSSSHNKNGSSFVLPVHENRTEFDVQDIFVPWKKRQDGKKTDVKPSKQCSTSKPRQHSASTDVVTDSQKVMTEEMIDTIEDTASVKTCVGNNLTSNLSDVTDSSVCRDNNFGQKSNKLSHNDSDTESVSSNSSSHKENIADLIVDSSKHSVANDDREIKSDSDGATLKSNSGDGATYHRYYHMFVEGELEELCTLVEPRVQVIQSYYDEGNWCIVLRKQ